MTVLDLTGGLVQALSATANARQEAIRQVNGPNGPNREAWLRLAAHPQHRDQRVAAKFTLSDRIGEDAGTAPPSRWR
jgi:hypothetical protein